MKHFIILLFSVFVFSCANTSNREGVDESTTDTANPIVKEDNRTDEQVLKDIKEQYQIIIQGKGTQQFKIDSMTYECPDYPEIGEVVYYTDELGIWLIENSFTQGDHGGRTDQYYLWDGKLFFLYSDESYWTFDAGGIEYEMQPNTVDYFTERRYYFHKDKVLKCSEKKYELRTSKKNNPKSENVHNVEIEADDAKERLDRFNQLLSLVGESDLEGTCIWE